MEDKLVAYLYRVSNESATKGNSAYFKGRKRLADELLSKINNGDFECKLEDMLDEPKQLKSLNEWAEKMELKEKSKDE